MTDSESARAFGAFREAVLDDHTLLLWLHRPLARDAYVAHVIAAGAECGFVFDEAPVRAAMREGEKTWLMQGGDIA